jgi:tetratricopeptide (TPR) repeat protein
MIKRAILIFSILCSAVIVAHPTTASAYNFGDMKSMTLVGKAWNALNQNDLEAVLAYTNKCLELYTEQAQKMQSGLTSYVKGTNEEIHSYWALNDVATAIFIQGEAYRKAGMKDEAKAAYEKLVSDYGFGQSWDPQGWFWKPADAAKQKLASLDSPNAVDFGDVSSAALVAKIWKASSDKNTEALEAYVGKILELYEDKAKEMQKSLSEYAWESQDKIFSYWALNDVGTALFAKGEYYRNSGKNAEAKKAYRRVIDEFSYAQCWDPQGWFWKPAEAAAEKLDVIEAKK